MNKVTEARMAAEANLVTRREETAAYHSQANTAKPAAENPWANATSAGFITPLDPAVPPGSNTYPGRPGEGRIGSMR